MFFEKNHILKNVFLAIYIIFLVLTIPLAFDVGGVICGLEFSLTVFLIYFILTTIKIITSQYKKLRWISFFYYMQGFFVPSLLTYFLTIYSVKKIKEGNLLIKIWEIILKSSTPAFIVSEGICSLLLIQSIDQTVSFLTFYKSDSWLIISLVSSGIIITGSVYFLVKIFVAPFTISFVSASLLGSLLTLTVVICLYGILSGKGSAVESSLLFAYVVRCLYEIFSVFTKKDKETLNELIKVASINFKKQIPDPVAHISDTLLELFVFITSNVPRSFENLSSFLIIAIRKLTLHLILNLFYKIGVFYAAIKIISLLSDDTLYMGRSSYKKDTLTMFPVDNLTDENLSSQFYDTKSQNLKASKKKFKLQKQHQQTFSKMKIVYEYLPCIIILLYTHLMMIYNGELNNKSSLWDLLNLNLIGIRQSQTSIVEIQPWKFWNWVNVTTTLLLYMTELLEKDLLFDTLSLTNEN